MRLNPGIALRPPCIDHFRDITLERQKNDDLQRHNENLEILLKFAVDLVELEDQQQVFTLIAKYLYTLTKAQFVTISEWIESRKQLILRYTDLESIWMQKFFSAFGIKPEQLRVCLTPEQYSEVFRRRWIVDTSLYNMVFGSIPRPLATLMEKTLGVNLFIGLSFIIHDRLYGTAMVGLKKEIPLPDEKILHTFNHVAALALRRKFLEEESAHIQAQLLQAQKMESVGRLAGGVAHDFNNMLGVIIGHADLALQRNELDEKTRETMGEILQAARRSAELTAQLLAFSRQQTAQPKAVFVDKAIENMLRMLRRTIGENIQLQWEPGAPGKVVWIDPVQLDQIVLNLVVNARDAIEKTGIITLSTTSGVLSREKAENYNALFLAGREVVQIFVRDTGCGMTPYIVSRLFEPFFTTKGLGRGTGMGLATVHGIVQQNQGCIHVESEPGKGSLFTLVFACTRPAETGQEQRQELAPGGFETILFVEDETAILRIGKTILERNGYAVEAFSDAAQALEWLENTSTPVHLLITDVIMPEINGRELWEKARAVRPDLKVLFVSGYPANIITDQGILDAATHYLQKPFNVNGLLAAVRRAIDDAAPSSRKN